MRPLFALLAVLAACQPGKRVLGTIPATTPVPTTTPVGTTAPPSTTTPVTSAVAPALSDFTGRLHPDFGTLVYAGWSQDQAADVHVEYSFDADEWLSSPPRSLEAGPHEELLLGVPYGLYVTWRIVAENPAGTATSPDQQLATLPVPSSMPLGDLTISDPSRFDPDTRYLYLSLTQNGGSFGDRWWVMVIDRKGRPVWGLMSDTDHMSMHPRVAYDGAALLVDQNAYWSQFGLGDDGSVEKILLDGTVLTTWATPGLHHPYQELPDGSLAWGAWTGWYSEALKVVHPDGSTDTLWDCNAWLASEGLNDFCASNTLNYNPATNELMYSFWSFETVIFIDAATGDTHKWFGHLPGAYAFDPQDSAFWYQHGGYLTDDGTFLVSSHSSDHSDEIVVREYDVDDANQTLHQVWNFGLGDGVYGSDMGEPHRLANGDTLHNTGTGTRIREATPEGDVVWDLQWSTDALGRSTPVSDLYAFAPAEP